MRECLTFDDVQIIPKFSTVASRNNVDVSTRFTQNYVIKNPLVAAPMDSVCDSTMMKKLISLGSVGCLHRFMSIDEQCDQIKDVVNFVPLADRSTTPIVASVGATGDYQERTERSVEAGANVILVDVAHGDHQHVVDALDWMNKLGYRNYFDIIAGNVATRDGAEMLESLGVDALRVGIGGGSMCETRIRTGVGIPQLTAVIDIAERALVPVISDGGIKYPGDVAKAIAAGADTVMLGSLFSGTFESPGDIFVTGTFPNEKKFKVFRGSASAAAKYSIKGAADYVEGTATLVSSKGSVENVVKSLLDGLRSSMSYVGADSIKQFQLYAEFIRITNAGLVEAHPHGLNK